MKSLLPHLRSALVSTVIFTIALCGLYPLAVWAIAQAAFKDQANGSLIIDTTGTVRGSRLLSQNFTSPQYFHPRPSAAGATGYDAASSGGSNLGPTSQKLADQIKERIAIYRKENSLSETLPIPADAVTASASGLDPHISPANAELQTTRVAKARNLPVEKIHELIRAFTVQPTFGLLGQPSVNVLELNLALDAIK